MACGTYPDHPYEYFANWRFVDGIVCYYGDQLGVTVFMLMFFAATFLGLYGATDSIMLPVVVLIVLAPLVSVLLPAIGIQFVVVILILMLGIAGFMLYASAGTH